VSNSFVVSSLLVATIALGASEPIDGDIEELPPPSRTQSVLVKERSTQVESESNEGLGLYGPQGRHYLFGRLAVADYVWEGQHRIVQLEREEPASLPRVDPNYLYYREAGTGRRWAIGTQSAADGTYAVLFQPAGGAKVWRLLHRAQWNWDGEQAGRPAAELTVVEPTCGN
jgi:hypothetical protein